jgi:hypothetical protein
VDFFISIGNKKIIRVFREISSSFFKIVGSTCMMTIGLVQFNYVKDLHWVFLFQKVN